LDGRGTRIAAPPRHLSVDPDFAVVTANANDAEARPVLRMYSSLSLDDLCRTASTLLAALPLATW
jgi:hypothetical protein